MTDLAPYSSFIAVSRYARWRDEDNRRETWAETVDRYVTFMRDRMVDRGSHQAADPIFEEVRDAILNLEVMPSMRALMTAGPALERSNLAGFNCSFLAVDDVRAFDEAIYVLSCGTGLGFSVEQAHISKLPAVPADLRPVEGVIVVEDSKEGWAQAYRELIDHLYNGRIPDWDMSQVRPKGARLKTFGGRASGPEPLNKLFRFTVDTFASAKGRQLHPIEVHDIICTIAAAIVSGGVRRSATISLSDLDSHEMAVAKSGNWWDLNSQRALANNSAVYYEQPSSTRFLREWLALAESGSGERGIINMAGIRTHAGKFGGRDASRIQGLNPCGEAKLRNAGLCNLTEVIIREGDGVDDVERKVRLAAVMGTWQSSLTDFPYVRDIWRENAEEERLLGVSLTGIYGNVLFNNPDDEGLPERLQGLRAAAREENAREAEKMGINPSVAITLGKPSGTVSELANCSSGIHPWYAPFYIRRVRGASNDPISRLLIDSGVPHEVDVMNPANVVFSFPKRSPEGAVHSADLSAIDHLRLYAIYRENYCEHTQSITVSIRDDEWARVGSWVYDNWDRIGGVSFLPAGDGHTYQQAPYEEVTPEEYDELVANFPKNIDFGFLSLYETEDGTTGNQTLACSAGGCDVVDIESASGEG